MKFINLFLCSFLCLSLRADSLTLGKVNGKLANEKAFSTLAIEYSKSAVELDHAHIVAQVGIIVDANESYSGHDFQYSAASLGVNLEKSFKGLNYGLGASYKIGAYNAGYSHELKSYWNANVSYNRGKYIVGYKFEQSFGKPQHYSVNKMNTFFVGVKF